MKKYHVYRMNFESDWLRRSAMCMGMSVFLLAAYYLGAHDLSHHTGGMLFLNFWLPLALGLGYIVLVCILRLNAPGVYAIVCGAFCLMYLLQALFSGNGFRVVIALPGYLLCAAVCVVVLGGYFPSLAPAGICFLAVVVLRVILFDLGRLSLGQWIAEGAVLCSMCAFIFLPGGYVRTNKKELSQ